MRDEELAEIAYNAYGDNRNWKVFSGAEMPTWEQQTSELCLAWKAAVRAVKEALTVEKS